MSCNKCGNEIVGDAKFCSKCGQPLSCATNSATTGKVDTYTLTINRAKQWYLVNPAVKIIVDGGAEYKIDNGETLNIPVSPGVHNIAFSCSIRNKIVNISATSNVVLNIKWNRITGSLEVE